MCACHCQTASRRRSAGFSQKPKPGVDRPRGRGLAEAISRRQVSLRTTLRDLTPSDSIISKDYHADRHRDATPNNTQSSPAPPGQCVQSKLAALAPSGASRTRRDAQSMVTLGNMPSKRVQAGKIDGLVFAMCEARRRPSARVRFARAVNNLALAQRPRKRQRPFTGKSQGR
jgi:hypothetical protein